MLLYLYCIEALRQQSLIGSIKAHLSSITEWANSGVNIDLPICVLACIILFKYKKKIVSNFHFMIQIYDNNIDMNR